MFPLVSEQVARARSYAARYPRAYWILLSGEVVQSVGFGMAVPFIAIYLTETIGASATGAGAVLALWALVGLFGQPIGGMLADRLGRRPVVLAGLATAGVAAVAWAIAGDVWTVAGLTVLWGVGNAVFEPAAGAIVADVAPRELRTEAYGLLHVVNNAGFTLGPPLTALLVWTWSLRAAFLVAGLTVLTYLLIAWRSLPETRPETAEDEPPARFREALRDRLLVLVMLGSGLAAFVYALFETALPVFLHDDRGVEIATWGLVFAINPLMVAICQYPISRWAGKRSSRGVLAAGSVILGISLAILWPFDSLAALVVAIVVFTIGEMLAFPVATAVAAEIAPERLRGSYQGALNLAFEGAWGPAALGGLWLIGLGHGELLVAAALPVGLLAAVVFFALPAGSLRRPLPVISAEPARP
jgi:MFS family permease